MSPPRYDALIVGSGAAGSIAAKELTESGLGVLLLEAGPNISEQDFPVPDTPREKGIDLAARARAVVRGQYIQARLGYFSDQYKHLFINDRQNPYTTPREALYLWIRGRQLGGRLHLYGRQLLRMTDYDFKAAGRDGYGQDWPKSCLAVGAAIHECGGACMGSDPATSVVNAFHQCWDVKNLFITDGSCFVSSGTVGPVLTIMALTARVCEYIAQEYKNGSLQAG